MMEKTYFIYRYIRHDKNEPFYIGMGTRQDVCHAGTNNYSSRSLYYRAFSKDRNRTCLGIMQKSGYDVEIMYETTDIKHVEDKEKEFISLYGIIYDGTGTLTNLTKGGKSFKTTKEYVKNHHFACKRKGSEFSHKKKMYMYGLDGAFIEEFNSVNGFYKKYKCGVKSQSVLVASIKNKKSYKGYFFSYNKQDKLNINEYTLPEFSRDSVGQYLNGELINVYKTREGASIFLKCDSRMIVNSIKTGVQFNGFVFKEIKIHDIPNIYTK